MGKSMLHGLPEPFLTMDRHLEVGQVIIWEVGSSKEKYEVYKCDEVIRENQLQNVYLKKGDS